MKAPAQIENLMKVGSMPVPWFVKDPTDFRIIDEDKIVVAILQKRCWICGQKLGRDLAFVGGPLSARSGLYSDPPSHPTCAEYAAVTCPFLSRDYTRRDDGLPTELRAERPLESMSSIEACHIMIVKKFRVIPGHFKIKTRQARRRIYRHGVLDSTAG